MNVFSLRNALRGAVLALAFCVAFPSAHAIDVNARIRGTVTDPVGAVVPNAQVTATNQATGVKFTTMTQGDGTYLFPQLPIGTYTISVTVSGFQSFRAKGIVLNIDQEYVDSVKLAVGNASETLEVSADAVQVNTTDMELSNIVDGSQMQELPLMDRNFTELELTLPGVQMPDNRFTMNYSVSGAQSQQSEYIINGADTNDIALNSITFQPILDAIGQFNMLDGPLNAEYDRNSGGIVSADIKQGTNHFHGDVYEFYRDTFLNTNNYVTKAPGLAVSPYHQNIFGGTLGGPIWKDKLFFFGAFEGQIESIPEGTPVPVPVYTSGNLAGNFSQDLGTGITTPPCTAAENAVTHCNDVDGSFGTNFIPSTITVPGCPAGYTWAQCAYTTGGQFATTSFNAVSTALVKQYVPAPNDGNKYSFNSTVTQTTYQYIGRIDYDFNPSNQITVVGIYYPTKLTETLPFDGASIPGFGDGDISHTQQWTIDYVRQINSTTVNDLSAHYTRLNFDSGAPQQVVQPSSAGFDITPQDSTSSTIPTQIVNGYFTLGGTADGPQPRVDQTIQFDDSFSKVIGNHSLKFGYDGRRFNVSNTFDSNNSGVYSFSSGGTYSTGDPGLDYLLGIPAAFTQGTGAIIQADAFLNYMYGQDTWKLTNSLTLDYGLGYSIDTPLRNHQYGGEGLSCFIIGEQSAVFPNAPVDMAFPGDPGCTDSGQAYTRYGEVGPRFGFAWAPDLGRLSGSPGKFSVRGGFGIYYNRTEEESALQTLGTPPFGFTSSGAGDFGGVPELANPYADINGGNTTGATGGPGTASEANRFPYMEPVKGQPVSFTTPISNISSFAPSFRAPYAENFQLTVERELPSKLIARISYVGSVAHRNQITYEANYETAAGHAACLANPLCVTDRDAQAYYFPANKVADTTGLIEEGEVGSEGSSSYHSLQISLTKAETHGFSFQMSYTFAHALDNGSSFENSGFGSGDGEPPTRGYNQYDQALNYGDSTYDARQHLVFSPIYISPVIHGNPFSPLSLALSGWQISGILTASTGLPYDISYDGYGTSNSLYCDIATPSFYACPDVPEQVAPLKRFNPKTNGLQWFSPSSFAAEPIGSFGNVSRDPYHGPSYNNTNLVLAKNFDLSADGHLRLQLRLESDNVFNHTNFNNPDGNYEDVSTTFGQIISAQPSRLTQLGGKFYF